MIDAGIVASNYGRGWSQQADNRQVTGEITNIPK